MFDIGFSELLIFGALALIILGPEKLPQAARTAGQWYAKFRRTVANLQHEIETELDLAETRKQLQTEMAKIRQAEAQMKKEMQALRGNMQQMQQQTEQALRTSSSDTSATDVTTSDNPDNPQPNPAYNPSPTIPLSSPTLSAPTLSTTPLSAAVSDMPNVPLAGRWFVIGEAEQMRRLPPAPRLPNLRADPLLNQVVLTHSSSSVNQDNTQQ